MFWDRIAKLYDFFEVVYNGKVYKNLGREVAKSIQSTDAVLECACGTGAISKAIAGKCQSLIATDLSSKMLKEAKRKCKKYQNAEFALADLMHLEFADNTFDKVVAGNVMHLLDEPQEAIKELVRVCRVGGLIILPTYVNMQDKKKESLAVRTLDRAGARFKRQFTYDSYLEFFAAAGYTDVECTLIAGKMPCAVAVIKKV